METEGSDSLQSLTEDFRAAAFALGISGEAVARMAQSPERALACVQECERQGKGAGLAVHMFDAGDWPREPKRTGVNLQSLSECETCSGDRFVAYKLRSEPQSVWARDRGISHPADATVEEVAPCPDCNVSDVSFRRADGTVARPPAVEHVRARL